jgi:hypothetical protein
LRGPYLYILRIRGIRRQKGNKAKRQNAMYQMIFGGRLRWKKGQVPLGGKPPMPPRFASPNGSASDQNKEQGKESYRLSLFSLLMRHSEDSETLLTT